MRMKRTQRPFIMRELCIISRLVRGVSYRTRTCSYRIHMRLSMSRDYLYRLRSGSALTAANDCGAGATLVQWSAGVGGPRVVAARGRAAERPRREQRADFPVPNNYICNLKWPLPKEPACSFMFSVFCLALYTTIYIAIQSRLKVLSGSNY